MDPLRRKAIVSEYLRALGRIEKRILQAIPFDKDRCNLNMKSLLRGFGLEDKYKIVCAVNPNESNARKALAQGIIKGRLSDLLGQIQRFGFSCDSALTVSILEEGRKLYRLNLFLAESLYRNMKSSHETITDRWIEGSILQYVRLEVFLSTNEILMNEYRPSEWEAYRKCHHHFQELLRAGAGWIFECGEYLLILPRPIINFNDKMELHGYSTHGAIDWGFGKCEHYWHGQRISDSLLKEAKNISPDKIVKISSVNRRRMMIDLTGMERMTGIAKLVHQDNDCAGPRRLFRVKLPNDEPITWVSIQCPSTGNNYHLRVPPEIHTCDEAIAWTFNLTKSEYAPQVET